MQAFLLTLLQAFLLVAALSVDAFVASFAYGADRIKIPVSSLLVICGVCTGILGVSLVLGGLIQPFLPQNAVRAVCFVILFALGVVKLFDSALKSFLRRHQPGQKKLHFCLAGVCFILQVYVDSTVADRDRSRRLSPGEAASLAFALSLDGLAVGFGAGLLQPNLIETLLLSLLMTAAAVALGGLIGRRIAEHLRFDLSWLSGALLILLAFLKLRG